MINILFFKLKSIAMCKRDSSWGKMANKTSRKRQLLESFRVTSVIFLSWMILDRMDFEGQNQKPREILSVKLRYKELLVWIWVKKNVSSVIMNLRNQSKSSMEHDYQGVITWNREGSGIWNPGWQIHSCRVVD